MPNYTTNLGLEKPLGTEQYNVEVFNSNADKIDQFAGQIPPRALTADKLTTGANINGILFKGDTDITLPVVDVDNVTIIKNGNGIISTSVGNDLANKDLSNLTTTGNNKVLPSQSENSGKYLTTNGTSPSWTTFTGANQDLSNLTNVGEDRLHALKGYEDAGELLTDAEGLIDVTSYAHSTFDESKFTKSSGWSGTITNDGVASGFSASNYLQTSNIINFSNNWTFETTFKTTDIATQLQPIFQYNSFNRIFIAKDTGVITLYANGDTSSTDAHNINFNLTVNTNTNYHIKLIHNNSDWTCILTNLDNNNTISDTKTLSYNFPNGIYYIGSDTGRYLIGSIGLKQFSIKVDGGTVFSGNQTGVDTYTINNSIVTIPYTLSKTGSKIVDSAYRSQVSAVYQAFGYAPYYTLSENSKINYVITGSPTITNDGIASGFSANNYLTMPFNPSNSKWEIILKTKLNETNTPILNCGTYCLDLNVSPDISVTRNRLRASFGNGSTWLITNQLGITELQTNTDYFIRIKYTETSYIISLSVDNNNWTDEIIYTSSTPINSNTLIIGKDYTGLSALSGSIDLNALMININGEINKAIQPPNFTLPMGEIYGMLKEDNWHLVNQNVNNSTAIGTTSVNFSQYIENPVTGAKYQCLFRYFISSRNQSEENTIYTVTDTTNNIVLLYDVVDSNATDLKAQGGQFTGFLSVSDIVQVKIENRALWAGTGTSTEGIIFLAYKRVV